MLDCRPRRRPVPGAVAAGLTRRGAPAPGTVRQPARHALVADTAHTNVSAAARPVAHGGGARAWHAGAGLDLPAAANSRAANPGSINVGTRPASKTAGLASATRQSRAGPTSNVVFRRCAAMSLGCALCLG